MRLGLLLTGLAFASLVALPTSLQAADEGTGLLFVHGRLKPDGAAAYQQYLAGTGPLLARHDGTVSAVGSAVASEHTGEPWPINALLTFPTVAAAESFLSDPDYLELKKKDRDIAYETLHLTLVAGRPPQMATAPSEGHTHRPPRWVAEGAFVDFRLGLATGKWQAFLDHLSDDFVFHFPMGRFQGEHRGREQAAEFFNYVSSVFSEGLTVTEVRAVTAEGSRVVFEFTDEGTLRGAPYRNRVAIALTVCDDKICGYEEYFGLVGPPPGDSTTTGDNTSTGDNR